MFHTLTIDQIEHKFVTSYVVLAFHPILPNTQETEKFTKGFVNRKQHNETEKRKRPKKHFSFTFKFMRRSQSLNLVGKVKRAENAS